MRLIVILSNYSMICILQTLLCNRILSFSSLSSRARRVAPQTQINVVLLAPRMLIPMYPPFFLGNYL